MKCSQKMMEYTGYLHIIAVVVAIYGTMHQIDAVKNKSPYSPYLSLALTTMLLLRIPNQICVATKEYHGWYSVIGTIVGATSFGYLAYVEYKAEKVKKKN
jgi:hypothetical protein